MALSRYQIDFVHFLISLVMSTGLPLLIYWLLDLVGCDITGIVYLVIWATLLITALLIISEAFVAALHPGAPERDETKPEPAASAIICAYMPNEQHTIMETVEHFLSMKYAGPELQVILAYNSPYYCPVETELRDMAKQYPNFTLLKVQKSTSKAENLNTALEHVRGAFVACFDADHMPEAGSFERAWRWLSNGYDVVQGHCLVRNPEESFWAKMVAIEFETIYALAHPGRTVRDGFGVFGGSNGYWRTSLLQRIGMVGAMLTEDIDSSMRVLEEGGKIGTDPKLISLELATSTFTQVWNQRLRWAQGWLQVSMKHCWPMMTNKHFGFRNRFGSFMLLCFRELYPWFSMQIIPLLIFWKIRGDEVYWGIQLFIASSIFTTSIGPLTVLATYGLSHPTLRKPWWFLQFLVFSLFFYTDLKNIICRVALVKQIFGETGWRVTPRSANAPVKDSAAADAENPLSETAMDDSSDGMNDSEMASDVEAVMCPMKARAAHQDSLYDYTTDDVSRISSASECESQAGDEMLTIDHLIPQTQVYI